MNNKLSIWKILFLILLAAGTIYILRNQAPYQNNRGKIFGTYYNITYKHNENLEKDIKKVLGMVDNSLSPFNKNSIITAVNNNKEVVLDSFFVEVFNLASKISERTGGAFDITVAPLVNAWGFGFKEGTLPDSMDIDSLLKNIGYNTVSIKEGKVSKLHPNTMLDCSAIAKGYGCDAVARLLRNHRIENFMIEIGGEVVTEGRNDKGKLWNIGISKPIDDRSASNNELQEIIQLSGKAMATSGNYRNYRIENGRKVAHTIDPRTGYTVQHSLLSATVIAEDCATADAYATAFMVLGTEKAMEVCSSEEKIDAFFIYSDESGNLRTSMTQGFRKYLRK